MRPTAPSRADVPKMGLFGLGWGEIAVVGALGLVIFGPDKLTTFAKDFGKTAAGLKEVSESFQEGFSEGQANVSTDGGSKALKSATEADVVPVADPEKAEKTTTKD